MSFSRYAIEKKQESNDRGVTWHDVDPSETRKGSLVGVARTLLECEDMDCDLEQDIFYVDDGILPEEICGSSIMVLPYGIAKRITWTYGAQCCDTWYGQDVWALSPDGLTYELDFGNPSCYDSGFQTCWAYASNIVDGSEIHNACKSVCNWGAICSCFRIDEFMPWADGKETWKLVYKQHQVRRHCSDEWENDGEAVVVNIGERWFPSAGADEILWQHQIASEFDESGNVITWINDGDADVQKLGHDLPSGYRYIEGLTLDSSDYSVFSFGARNRDTFVCMMKGIVTGCRLRFMHFTLFDSSRWDYYGFNKIAYCPSESGINDYCGGYGGFSNHMPNFGSFTLECINPETFSSVPIYIYESAVPVLRDATVNLYSVPTTSIKVILLTRDGQIIKRLIPVMYGDTKKMFDSLSGTIYSLS